MEEERVLKYIKKKRKDRSFCISIATTKSNELSEALGALGDDFERSDVIALPMGDEVWYVAETMLEALAVARADRKFASAERALQNRGLYLPVINVQISARADGTCMYRFTHGLDASGLMARMLEHMGVDTSQPVQMGVINRLPFTTDPEGNETRDQYQVPSSEIDSLWKHGYLFSGNKTIWNFNIKELRDIFVRALPRAIDFQSYNRRFRAPLVPAGFIPAVTVRTVHQLVKHCVSDTEYTAVSQGVDGSGLYDPDHVDAQEFVARNGAVNAQITAICPATGKLWKGLLSPRTGINDNLPADQQSAFHFDHQQVKGAFKDAHQERHRWGRDLSMPYACMDHGAYIGIMKAKTKMGRVSNCFEVLEQIGPCGPFNSVPEYLSARKRVRGHLTSFVREGIQRIADLGPEGLLGRATRDDPQLRRLAEFLVAANAQGANINPLDIPMIRGKLDVSLCRTLWGPTQGAAIVGKYPQVIIDDTLEPGTCVVAHVPVGKELACWRFPTILAQGLRVLKTVRPRAHHLVYGEIIPGTLYMNSYDIVTCQQGDDDGDEVGINMDERLVDLFGARKDNRIFHIEPAGQKLPYNTLSDEGREYIAKDPTGPIGFMTIMKAGLAAVGAKEMELAFTVGCQEAIDSQKRHILATDMYRAADINNWYQDENGEYHIHYKVDGEYVTNNFMGTEVGEFPLDEYKDAYERELIKHGCSKILKTEDGDKTVAGWPLGWRTQHRVLKNADGTDYKQKLVKAVAFDHWEEYENKQDGDGANWVHFVHDIARSTWGELQNAWTSDSTLPVRNLLPEVLKRAGTPLVPSERSWEQYAEGLRERSGLVRFGKELKKTMGQAGLQPQEKLAAIDQLRAALDIQLQELSAQDLLDIWWMELKDCYWYFDHRAKCRVYVQEPNQVPDGLGYWKVNTPNYAFTAVANKHSAIMKLLGFELQDTCQFMVHPTPDRAHRIINWCFNRPGPYHRLTTIVRADTAHSTSVHDENGEPVHLSDCVDCMTTLRTLLVRRVRDEKSAKEIESTKQLVTALNKQDQLPLPGWVPRTQKDTRPWQEPEFEVDLEPDYDPGPEVW